MIRIFLLSSVSILILSCYGQNSKTIIHGYEQSWSIEEALFREEIHTTYSGADTIDCFELIYFHFANDDLKRCKQLRFMITDTSGISKNYLADFFRKKKLYFVRYSYLNFYQASQYLENQKDTFYYNSNLQNI